MGKSSRPSLTDDVLGRIVVRKPSLSWFDRLPPDVQAETLEIRKQFASGALSVSGVVLARAMVDAYTSRGYSMSSPRQVREWLSGKTL